MRFPLFVCLLSLLAAPAAARTLVGRYGDWATFCDGPRRCLALTQTTDREHAGALAVLFGDGTILVQSDIPLRSARLTIDGRHFALVANEMTAHAPDRRAARAIVASLRAADSALLDARTAMGTRLRQHYRLRGAPTAIDAAALASIAEGGKNVAIALDRPHP